MEGAPTMKSRSWRPGGESDWSQLALLLAVLGCLVVVIYAVLSRT
jgi:hypothetical protein